jgi:urea transport system permease protein
MAPGARPGPFRRSGVIPLLFRHSSRVLFAVLLWLAAGAAPAAPADDQLSAALTELARAEDFEAKSAAVGRIASVEHSAKLTALTAFVEGQLHYREADQRMFVVKDEPPAVLDLLSGTPAAGVSADSLTRITSNNALRKSLRGVIASFKLADRDPQVRVAAVTEMLRIRDEETVAMLRAQLVREKDEDVREAIAAGLALADLDSEDAAVRLAAIEALEDSLSLELRNRLEAMVTADESGAFPEPDERVRAAAAELMQSIDDSRWFYSLIETLFFGLSTGSILVLIAIGLAITFGVMGVINMAHGELMMLGAYCTFAVQQILPGYIGASVIIAIPLAFVVSGAVGILIQRFVVRYLSGRPLDTLLATFGISLILQQAVRSYQANNVPVQTPSWMSGPLQINEALALTWNRVYVFVFALMLFAVLVVILKKTTLGLKVRAVALNRPMAKAMGVRTEWVDAMTFGLGSGIAGIAGVALSQLTNVGPNLGQGYIIDSFMVVVFGGVGNLWGTLIGGTSLGVINKVLEPWAGAVTAKILVLVAVILFIQGRPRGLFPQKGRAAEN